MANVLFLGARPIETKKRAPAAKPLAIGLLDAMDHCTGTGTQSRRSTHVRNRCNRILLRQEGAETVTERAIVGVEE